MEFNGTFLVVIVSFILFVVLMNKILYQPVLEIMQKRKEVIDNNYQHASENDTKAESLLQEKEDKLANAKNEAKQNYISIVDEFKSKKADAIADAQGSAKDEIEQKRIELENISNEAKAGLKNRMNELANDITEKILGYRSNVEGFDNEAIDRVLWGKGE